MNTLQEDDSVLTNPLIVFNGFLMRNMLAMLYTNKTNKKKIPQTIIIQSVRSECYSRRVRNKRTAGANGNKIQE